MEMSTAFDDPNNFRIEIPADAESDTGPVPEVINFEYTNPAISINTGGRFIKHGIIGGATVRQRIGDEPLEIDITGVCIEQTARQIALLRNAKYVILYSGHLPVGSIRAQIVSISTDPFEEGGAVKLGEDEFLYSYTLNAVEIDDSGD